MKQILAMTALSPRITATIGLTAAGVVAVAFWFTATPATQAQSMCTLCHKRTQTLNLTCGSAEYRRHVDHGDSMGACAVTPVENP